MMELGIYEQLINKLVASRLAELDRDIYFIGESPIEEPEAARILSNYLADVLRFAMGSFQGDDALEKQIDLANKVIRTLKAELQDEEFEEDMIATEAKILSAVFARLDSGIVNFEQHLKEITPYSRLSHSELFTGSNAGISMESELKKEILSADRIYFLVSFIKWTGIRIFEKELADFTARGGVLKVITTSYMGATDLKAVNFLASLPNTEIKVSYNTSNERLHAKAYLFYRNTGFHTGYIGSSNFSHSALTKGLEWNMKVTTREVGHIIEKFQKTFDSYWQDPDFELYSIERDANRLKEALGAQKSKSSDDVVLYFDLKPFPSQFEILEKLETEREVHGRYRNLVVAATGTGKTAIAAFDFKRFLVKNPNAKLLFVAHRKEILEQARSAFRGILKDNSFGELWADGLEPSRYDRVFASVQTLNSRMSGLQLSPSFYDYIVIDEVHHIAANSYRPILERFQPQILLGLTATPERMDGADILDDFCGHVAAEIRLPEALNRKLLCPFQYFGIADSVDLTHVQWRNGRYVPGELTNLYTANDRRLSEIIKNLHKYLNDVHEVRALGFCVTVEHAKYMAEKFVLAGFRADYLVSDNSSDRDLHRRRLRSKEINYLFVVDIFNEGVDIPEIDTVLFLRPTESLTIFLQQFGRGLRNAEGKECLTVLDFVGNARSEYDFEGKFRALVGKTNTPITQELENDFPHLPLGCSITLERQAKEYILTNIRNATQLNRAKLILKIRNFKHDSVLPLTLRNFLSFHHLSIQQIYKRDLWTSLCREAGVIERSSDVNVKAFHRAIWKKWLGMASFSYFQFIHKLAERCFDLNFQELSEKERSMCLMLHYDVWQEAGGFESLEASIRSMGANPILANELKDVMEILMDRIDFIERPLHLPFEMPLMLHGRYSREQILAAFGFSSFERKSSIREGVAVQKGFNTEILFITLDKSDAHFSPTTMFEDYALSDTLFHWQTQNRARPDNSTGKSYIHHQKLGKRIMLFVRERNEDEFGNTMGFVFLGEATYQEHSGSRPMNIIWRLHQPMPPFLWKDSVKLVVG